MSSAALTRAARITKQVVNYFTVSQDNSFTGAMVTKLVHPQAMAKKPFFSFYPFSMVTDDTHPALSFTRCGFCIKSVHAILNAILLICQTVIQFLCNIGEKLGSRDPRLQAAR